MLNKINTALISVSDKSNLLGILKVLKKFNINIISSGGTHDFIRKNGYKCKEISRYTGFKEMLDGRVKTLHPKIHAGILHDRNNIKHSREMKGKKFPSIDLIIVNFYPFQNFIKNKKSEKKIINNIDIGGPTLVRAAAKNYKNVTIITNINDYKNLIKELETNKGKTSLKFRENLSSKAFGLTAYYDAMISDWFNKKLKIEFPERKIIFGKKYEDLRYGENPHQKGSIYINDIKDKEINLDKIHGKKLSYNNYNDSLTAVEMIKSFREKPTTVIIKHANPCGVSVNKSAFKSYLNALKSDPVSAYGGILAVNYKISEKIAKEINKNFYEVVIADSINNQALKILKQKKNLRILKSNKFRLKSSENIKFFDGKFMIQSKDNIVLDKKKIKFVTKKKIKKKDMAEAEFAFNVCRFVKSNSIIITNKFSTIGIGSGQPSRLDSCKIAVAKAKKFNKNKIKGSVAASDAFFPFADGLKILIKSGVKIVIQPGGSKRDIEVVREANNAKISMIFTQIRHFNH